MGSSYGEERDSSNKRFQKIKKACIAWMGSFLISLVGGLILSCWEFWYHRTNSQLWMVPVGLIMFFTPIIVWFSVFISDICNSSMAEAAVSSLKQQPPIWLERSVVGDPEKDDRKRSTATSQVYDFR